MTLIKFSVLWFERSNHSFRKCTFWHTDRPFTVELYAYIYVSYVGLFAVFCHNNNDDIDDDEAI